MCVFLVVLGGVVAFLVLVCGVFCVAFNIVVLVVALVGVVVHRNHGRTFVSFKRFRMDTRQLLVCGELDLCIYPSIVTK